MGVDEKIIARYPEEAVAIVARWGWTIPTVEVMDLAALSFRMRGMKSGEALIELGAITQARLDSLLGSRPGDVRTLEWIAQNDPGVRGQIEKVLTLRTGYPFYDSLDAIALHPKMQEPAVIARCDALDAVLLQIEERRSLLVFSSQAEMLNFSTAGREERMGDPIRKALLGEEVLLAVAKADQVILRLSSAKAKDGPEASSNIVAMWYGSNAEDENERKIARIIDYGLSTGASDVSIAPERGKGSIVEIRKNGDMISCPVADRLSVEEAIVIVDFLLAKSNANPNLAKIKEPKDGNIIYRSGTGDAELRLSFIPMNQPGEYLISVSIRLMAKTQKRVELEKLNIEKAVRGQISAAAKLSKGFILLVGGTNTGKSTTIAGALEENRRHFGRTRKRISLEKPVERLLEGVTQINIPADMEDGFNTYLKSIKRHDPDVISIGEILDGATADVAVTAAISGHLVLSTTHANDTLLGYDSVAQMLPPNKRYQYIESLSLIVAQDMVREVCKCGTLHEPTADERELFNAYKTFKSLNEAMPEETIHINPSGCELCKGTGISSVRPINEVLPVTAVVKNAMFSMLGGQIIGPSGENFRETIAQARTSTLFQAAMDLVRAGAIELGEAIR